MLEETKAHPMFFLDLERDKEIMKAVEKVMTKPGFLGTTNSDLLILKELLETFWMLPFDPSLHLHLELHGLR